MEQLHFPLPSQSVSDTVIHGLRDELSALAMTIEASGLEKKQVAAELDISESHLSEILSGRKNVPFNLPQRIMDLCGNEIYLQWLVYRRGYGLVRLRSSLEMENERLREEVERQAREMAVIKSFLKDVKGI